MEFGAGRASVGGSQSVGGRRPRGRNAGRRARLLGGLLGLLLTSRRGGGRDGQEALLLSFLLLHSAVLEPDLHLGLVELQGRGDLHPAGARQVLVEVKLLLQLRELLGGEVGAHCVGLTGIAELSNFP